MAGKWVAKNLVEVAQFFRVAHATVKEWKRNGMPGAAGAFDLAEITHWREQRRAAAAEDGVDAAKRRVELRKITAEAEKQERAVRKLDGELIDRRQVEGEVAFCLAEARKIIQRVPQRLAPSLDQEHATAIVKELRRHLDVALVELADRMAVAAPAGRKIAEMLLVAERKRGT